VSDFKAKMYPNRFPRWGAYKLERSSRPLAGITGTYFEGKGYGAGRGKGREWRDR